MLRFVEQFFFIIECQSLFLLALLISSCVCAFLYPGDLGRTAGVETEEKEGNFRRTFRSQVQRPVVPGECQQKPNGTNKYLCVVAVLHTV